MRPALCLTLILALVLTPIPIGAQTLTELLADQPELEFVPKLQLTDCATNQKCVDFDNYKLYLQMRAQYAWLFDVHVELVPSLTRELNKMADEFEAAEKVQRERAIRAEEAYDGLFPKYVAAVRGEEKAKGRSILGGGLPWLLVAVAAGFIGGVLTYVAVDRGQANAQ